MMVKMIWKFLPQLFNENTATVMMPIGARVLTVLEQHNQLCLWAEIDTSAEMETRIFKVYGTGCEIDHNHGSYIGTAMLFSGTMVLHVYEAK